MIRVLIADDETLVRDALASLLELDDDIDVVGVAASGTEAVAAAARLRPDLALLDLQMPGLDGIEAASQIRAVNPACNCIIVTSHGRPGYLKKALGVGVRGFLPKTTSASTLARVIREVHAGGRHVDPQLAAEAIAAGDSPLTPRESDVLEYAADGAPVEEIALRAHLSAGTVRNYLSSAVAKLGTNNRHEAIRLAQKQGWI
ncbi:response regulator transcription factor [Luteococcus sp. H138]|uniref:response regulator transcription factor n=1 Tax=unclassified Luteococcus TaxID=2639923 RepID=UPI00313C6A15